MNVRAQVINAFSPNSEVEEPEIFAGRKQLIFDLSDSLMANGSCPIIYGERGLGKTSLALQVARVALGDDQLLAELRGKDRILPAENAFVPFWISCSKEIRTKNGLLQRIINTAELHESLSNLAGLRLKSMSTSHKLKLPLYEAEARRDYDKVRGRKSYSKLDYEEKLLAVVDRILEDGAPGVLFIIDELDRVSRTEGLADFIKNASSKRVKFLLVGVAQDVSALLADHESVARILHPFPVSRMGAAELREVVDKVMRSLRRNSLNFVFSDSAVDRLVEASGGFPWFVHCIGQEALLSAHDDEKRLVELHHVATSISRLAKNKFAQQYSDMYQKAVRDSAKREVVLRLFAKWPHYDIPVGEIYRLAKRAGVSNPSALKSNLLTEKFGGILIAPPGHNKGQVRFGNAVFKRYILLRDSLFDSVKEEVDDVWNARE